MALKLTKKDIVQQGKSSEVIKLKKNQISYDEASLSSWESSNKSSYETLNKIYDRLSNNEWLSQDDLSEYRSAIDKYISSTENIRGLGGIEKDDDSKWQQNIADLNTTYDDVSKFHSKYESAEEFSAYLEAVAKANEEQEQMKNADLNALRKEIDELQKEYDKGAWGKNLFAHYSKADDLKKQIAEKTAYLNRAERLQTGIELSSVANNEDFDQYNDYVSTEKTDASWLERLVGMDYGDFTYEYINNRDNPEMLKSASRSEPNLVIGVDAINQMEENEIAIYNYLYAKESEDKANEFLKSIEESLNNRAAQKIYEQIEGKTGLEMLFGAASGFDQFMQGLDGLVSNEEYISQSVMQQASGMVREDLKDNGFKLPDWLGGSSIGQIAYDAITTTSNMLPSILASTVANFVAPGSGAIVGSTLLGASAAGNAKAQMLNLGYSKGQANLYGVLVGVSEGGLQYLLGGIGGFGEGGVFTKFGKKALSKIDNAFARVAITLGGNMLDEGLEEGLQTIIEPWLESLVTGVDFDAPNIDEILYSSLLGMLSSLGLEGGSTIVGTSISNINAKKQYGGVQKELVAEGIELGGEAKAFAEKYQARLDKGKKLTGSQLNRLIESNEIAIQNQDRTNAEESNDGEIIDSSKARVIKNVDNNEEEKTFENVSENGKTTQISTGEEISIKEIEKVENGELIFVLENGNKVNSNDVEYGSNEEALLYENALEMGLNSASANTFIRSFDASVGLSAKEYALGFKEAYTYGKYSIPENEMSQDGMSTVLSEDIRKLAYGLGAIEGKYATDKNQEGVKAKEKAPTGSAKKKGKLHFQGALLRTGLNDTQRASLKALEVVSEALGIDVYIFESPVDKNGKRLGKNGFYNPKDGSIHLDLYAGANGKGTMLFTLAHELTHFIRQWSPSKFKVFADFLLEQYGKEGVSVKTLIQNQIEKAKKNGRTIDYDTAYEEVIADACETMLVDSNATEYIAKLKAKDESLWQKIKDFIANLVAKIKKAYAGITPDSAEASYVRTMLESAEKLQDLWTDALVDASESYSEVTKALGEGATIEVNEEGEFTVGQNKEGTILYNDRTFEDGGREALAEALEAEGFSEADINAALTIIDAKHQLVKQLGKEFTAQDITNKATLITDIKNGHSTLSALVQNGDYPVNIDLLTICKKRQAYQRVISRLCETGLIEQATLDSLAINEINKILGKYGFETACLGCFVESKRLRIQEYAETICKEWNSLVNKKVGKDNAKSFGFAKDSFVENLTNEEIDKLTKEYEQAINEEGRINVGKGSYLKKFERIMDAVPALQKHLSVSDIATPQGLANLKSVSPELFGLVASRYGSGSPKPVQEFNPYNSEIAKYGYKPKGYSSLREYLYAIGGARMQSFSDFIIENWFDYCQIVADLSARRLPMHTYTKEIALVKLFGMTGIKINMSLIPDIDKSLGKEYAGLTLNKDGKYELIFADKDRYKATGGRSYMQSINFADAVALQSDSRYSANIGTIAIGVSDNQILMMLDDNRIRQIIPYHKSGIHPIFANLAGVDSYEDYTDIQSTGIREIFDSNGKKISLKLSKDQKLKLTSGFEFNKVLQELGDARKASQAYIEWCEDASKHSITIDNKTYNAVLIPKFEKFSSHQNYYKLLEDFNTYDCITEQPAPQLDVQQNYPDNFEEILRDELDVQQNYRNKQEPKWESAMSEIEEYLKTHTHEDTVAYADENDIKLSKKERKGVAKPKKQSVKYSDRDSLGNELSAEQQEFFKDSKVRDERGRLLVCYHGTKSQFTEFDREKIGSNHNGWGAWGKGFYFSSNSWRARQWGDYKSDAGLNNALFTNKYSSDVKVMQVYINLVNPYIDMETHDNRLLEFVLNNEKIHKLVYEDRLVEESYVERNLIEVAQDVGKIDVQDMLKRFGYDGIICEYSNGNREIVAYEPNQIKSTTNKTPTTNADIRYSDRDSQGNSLTVEQQDFFRDSKVRDNKGNLKLVYHGTTANFNTFKKGDIGFHFGTKGAARGRVGYGKNVTLKEVYLNITNPIVFDEDLGSWDADYRLTLELYERGILTKEEAEMVLLSDDKTYRRPTEKANTKLREILLQKGYDGIEYRNTFESKKDSTSYIAFNSNQAKEITNQKPTLNPDIRYSERDYPIDAEVEKTVNEALTKSKSSMHILSDITSEQNKAINRLVNQTKNDLYRGKFEGGKHKISDDAIRHSLAEHGDFLREGLRAQLPITTKDIARHLSATKSNKMPSSIKATKTNQGNPSILTSYEVNGYTLYAEEITKSLGKNLPSDLIGHTMYKAPTLSTAAFNTTSVQNQPKRQSMVLCSYYTPNSNNLSTGNFIADSNGEPALLKYLSINGNAKQEARALGLIAMSSNDANLTDKKGNIEEGYVLCKNPFYITNDRRVFDNSQTDVLAELQKLKKQGYDCFVFDKVKGDNYMVAVFNKSQIIKNKPSIIKLSDRDTDTVSNRTLLANALESTVQNDIEKQKLAEYQSKIETMDKEQARLQEIRAKLKELSFAKGTRDTKRINELKFEANRLANRINIFDRQLLNLESTTALKNVLERERQKAYKKAEAEGREALARYRERETEKQKQIMKKYQESRKNAVAKAKETREHNDAKTKLQKLVIETSKWISYPTKDDVKCPDILREPYANFLKSINLSSQTLLKGGGETHNDIKVANAMSSLAVAIEKIKHSQNPATSVDDVLDVGYIDLPENFVDLLREMAENISKSMVPGNYVINQMSAKDIKSITKLIRTLNHAIKEMSTLYSNLRFAKIEELGSNTMDFLNSMGEAKSINGFKDFVGWDNALPYYAFKRFGIGGESVFEELMDGQDKLALLAQQIFAFKDKAWTDKEAKAWGNDVHTISLPNGSTVSLTTSQAMGIYCLSRREQGLQHLLGGGVRVIGLKKGAKQSNDSRVKLSSEDIYAITSSLTDRQKKVAEDIQEYMSTVCAEWGNEISMKRFLTKEFTEKFYYPIESNDENLGTKDPKAQQSDLYRLLNISATKPITPKANNEIIIRDIFEVFTEHASDMARLNAFGMPLLDYMKWLNYRIKTVNGDGQIDVQGVRQSMNRTYGSSAFGYVLNLIKDINGRHNDNADNTFLMQMMRMSKVASVGNNLRVALLQFTSYPRAIMKLSIGSLVKGLTKAPQINKAKKYCGIALWKSFGFYDTNIARSIEDQIKGATNIRQKLIELSLKGAEWADAITWGALWNACEYEVAKTTKNKIGSEEFNMEVGKKLREVVYSTQVVDSVLTRSQIMRSKSGLTQTATAFMSEPTLTANILMDAGYQFHKEKRITGSAKMAWKNTKKAICMAVGSYCVLQLMTSLAESLMDAWRDDDDDDFGTKFGEAFKENIITNIIPFNKIPIVSDIVSMILSKFDIGYFSSDRLDITWLSQIATAIDSWSEIIVEASGGKETSKTVYNAIYNTTKALSSIVGVSVSGLMREVVALWNNTAGEYDSTLKIHTYEPSQTELGNSLYNAIVEGNDREAKSLKEQFEDETKYEAALRKALRENDPRIKEAAEAVVYDKNATKRIEITREIKAEGNFSQDIIIAAINAEINALNKELKKNK